MSQPSADAIRVAQSSRRRLGVGAISALVPVVIVLMLLAFLTPAIHSGAHDLPLALAGPQQAVAPVQAQLAKAAPGAFEVQVKQSPEAAVDAVRNRDAIGAITVGPEGPAITIASGAGAPYAALLRNLAAGMTAAGQKVTVTDVAPMTADDPAGVGLTSALLPLVFGGMASSALLALQVRSARKRVLGAVVVALVGSLAAALVLQTWFGAVDGSFWLLWAGLGLGILAISSVVLGLFALLGFGGLGLGAVLMLFVSNPLSGFATGPQWLPGGWAEFGQLMPMGAASTMLRSAAYFDGRGMGVAPWVLLVWVTVGLALTWWGSMRSRPAISRA